MTCCHSEPEREPAGDCCHGSTDRSVPEDIWLRMGIALVVAGQTMVWGLAYNLSPPAYLSPGYLIGHGWMILSTLLVMALLGPFLAGNALDMLRSKRLTVEGLFILTAMGALVASLLSTITGQGSVYYEVVSVVLAIYTTGSFIGEHSRSKTREAVRSFETQFDTAARLSEDGDATPVPVASLAPGERVLVQPGESIAIDGTVISGSAYVRESTLTGEPRPRPVRPGDRVEAGSWALDGRLVLRVEAAAGERTLDRLLRLLEDAREAPSRLQRHADRITQWFLPVVTVISAGTFLFWVRVLPWPEALFHSMAVLLVACPCALGLATPIAIWSGLYSLFQNGIISRSAQLLDTLAETQRIFFDKTGTLSEEAIRVIRFEQVEQTDVSLNRVHALVQAMEAGQSHPIARALLEWAPEPSGASVQEIPVVDSLKVIPGAGLEGRLRDAETGRTDHVRLGEFPDTPSPAPDTSSPGKPVTLEVDGSLWGRFYLCESLRPELNRVFKPLEQMGIPCEILTGDASPAWKDIEGVAVRAGCTPEEKRERVVASSRAGEQPLFIGDGINDTAAMQAAAASLAVDTGADLARSVATGIVRGTNLSRIVNGITMARKIRRTLVGNLYFAAGYNGVGISLAAAGLLHPVVAALLMVGSSLFVSVRAASSANVHRQPMSPGCSGRGVCAVEDEAGPGVDIPVARKVSVGVDN